MYRARAVRFHEFGGIEALELEEVTFSPPSRRDLLIAPAAAALNPKDIFVRKGRFRWLTRRQLPLSPGYDFCGRVVATGPATRRFKVGDRVFGMSGGFRGGACAELLAINERRVCAAPASVDDLQLATVPLAGLTAYQALTRIARLKPGQSVCINGASGGVGTLAIQIARELGALVTTLSSADNIPLCRELGAHCARSYARSPMLDEQEFECFFDVFGNRSLREVKRHLASDGIYVTTIPSLRNFRDQLRTSSSLGRRARVVVVRHRRADLEWLADRLAKGRIRPVVDRSYSLETIDEAFRHLESKRARGKIAIRINDRNRQ